jgi:glycosyltransferase involved in cell wall biosynthesis
MKSSPEITVLMPVYNASRDLKAAIDSILTQSFKDFELLIIDDGSQDDSVAVIEGYLAEDTRINLIKNNKNSGIVYSLNIGLELAKGKFIARMDADDISLPDRLRQQINLLNTSNADICGCHWLVMNENNKLTGANLVPLNKGSLVSYLANGIVPFAHGSVMIRNRFLLDNNLKYGPNRFAEDYNLWVEIFCKNGSFVNCNEFLYKYREYSTSLSKICKKEYLERAEEIRRRFICDSKDIVRWAIDNQIKSISELTYLERVNLFRILLTQFNMHRSVHKIYSSARCLSPKEILNALARVLK